MTEERDNAIPGVSADRERDLRETRNADIAEAGTLLAAAGVDPTIVQSALTPGLASLIVRHPALAQEWARKYPSGSATQYSTLEATEFGAGVPSDPLAYNIAANQGFTTSANGVKKYANGVMVSAEGQVFYPPNAPNVAGSDAWIANAAKWDKGKIDKWRKKLADYGFIADEQGGWAADLPPALKAYHDARFAYGNGKPIKASGSATMDADPIISDPAERRAAVRAQYQRVHGDDGSDAEIEEWTKFIAQRERRLQRAKGYSPEYAATVAEEEFIEKFEGAPQQKYALDVAEEQSTLKDALIQAASATDFLAIGR